VREKNSGSSKFKSVGGFFQGRGRKRMGEGVILEKELDDLGLLEKAKELQQRLNGVQRLLNRTNDMVLLGILRQKREEATSKRKKILVVEDEFGLQATLREVFQLEGYDVRVAVDGDEGYEVYRRFKPDLILTDIVMPRMSGLELVREIRKSDRGIRVVYMSGFFGVKTLKKELDEEVARYGYPVLPKPTKISVLLGLVKEYLGE